MAWFAGSAFASQVKFERLFILVPAERGGGWDLTAKAMAEALQVNGEAGQVVIEYSPGAGGLIGLAQFVSSRAGQGDALLVGGMFTVGAAVQNRSAVSLMDTTPLARLAVDRAVVAVPVSSRIRTAEDLIEAMLSAPGSLSFVGGSRAGVDELNLLEIARALGIPASRLPYTGLPGGGEVGEVLADGRYDVGISGYSEFAELVDASRLRIVAVVREADAVELNVASFERLGIGIEHLNWRGVFAPPGISVHQRQTLLEMVDRLVASPTWKQLLLNHHWEDAYLAGDDFVTFVRLEQGRIGSALDSMKTVADPPDEKVVGRVLARRYVWALALAVLSLALVGILLFQRSRAHRREAGLQHAFEEATGKVIQRTEELEKALAGIHAQIEQDFDAWNLTIAEREVALLLLKGLRLKEIADARGTSERTVRQQAQAVYKKAGLEGRSELAAFFIEDFMLSLETQADAAKA